ncbi:hypothetical protein AMTRI_Chr09g13140 [Amborella trichopoda]
MAQINGVKMKGRHSKGETLAVERKLHLKSRQLRPTNSRLLCKDGRPTCLKPFSYSISLSLPMHPLPLSKPHEFNYHSLSLSKTRQALSLRRALSLSKPEIRKSLSPFSSLSFTNYRGPNTPSRPLSL